MAGGLFQGDADPDDVFAPPFDPMFSYLYGRVVEGFVPLYRANIPLTAIRVFSEAFRPDKTSDGRLAMESMKREMRTGQLTLPVWLYPNQGCFILSDDYVPLFILQELGISSYWCMVMGQFSHPLVTEIQGPAPSDFLKTLPGGS
jgi:hypothetical protein